MKLPTMWPQALVLIVLLVAMLLGPLSIWTGFCGIVAGVIGRSVWITWDADRRLRKAERARAAECDCHAPGGYPHEPDCIWWNRGDLKEARARERAGK